MASKAALIAKITGRVPALVITPPILATAAPNPVAAFVAPVSCVTICPTTPMAFINCIKLQPAAVNSTSWVANCPTGVLRSCKNAFAKDSKDLTS